jgi:hypothetical protein
MEVVMRDAHENPSTTTLSFEWRAWLADNLIRGVDPERLCKKLHEGGVPPDEAARRIDELLSSPALSVGRAYAREMARLDRVLLLGRTVERLSPRPTEVERIDDITGDDFYRRYVATGTPVVIESLARRWPALSLWTPRYFRERFGDVEVTMTDGREADPYYDARTAAHSRTILFRDYVARVEAAGETNDFYLVAQNRNLEKEGLAPLLEDVAFPDGFLDMDRVFGGSALWFGPAGTLTPLHHDCSNILFTQIYGEKSLRLVSPREARLFEGALSMYAGVDPDALDGALVKTVVLRPGDTLFIPVGWWHEVRSLGVSISLAFSNFARDVSFDWYRPGDIR